MTTLTRRQALHAAAWSVPVIALATAAPMAAASHPTCEPVYYRQPVLGPHDVAYITITREAVIIEYTKATDIIDINVHVAGQPSINVHRDWPKGKAKLTKTIALPGSCPTVTFVQVHGCNTHAYEGGVFA